MDFKKIRLNELGFVEGDLWFPEDIELMGIVDEYNEWLRDIYNPSSNIKMFDSEHFINLTTIRPFIILPFCVWVMKQRVSHIVYLFEKVCPISTLVDDSFDTLKMENASLIKCWGSKLSKLTEDELNEYINNLKI